jgi:acyl-ACP thioesterase
MDTRLPRPAGGRVFTGRRRIRLADMDASGRLRLDAIARFLQDLAIDDVQETGWGTPRHLWFVRRIRVDVLAPFLEDRLVDLETWCSGVATIAAGRRWSLVGDRGGRAEVDSVWIHLGPDGRPERIGDFGVYGAAAAGRRVSARPELPDPPGDAERRRWPLRAADVDQHGHVNNAVYWQAVEEVLAANGPDPRAPFGASLDYRDPLDLGDELELAVALDGTAVTVGFVTQAGVRAIGAVEPLPG